MWLKGLFATFFDFPCSLIPLMGAKSVVVISVVEDLIYTSDKHQNVYNRNAHVQLHYK